MSDSQLYGFKRDRQAIIDEVIDRVTRDVIQEAWDSSDARLDNLLNEAAFVELSRSSTLNPLEQSKANFWRQVVKTIARSSEDENAELIRKVVSDYANETSGNFKPAVQKFATRWLPKGMGLLASTLSNGLKLPSRSALTKRVSVSGEVELVRQLADEGTLVFVCPHYSRMDAVFMGLAMHLAGLPPLIHGADQQLFDNPLTAFFMSNLGAYRVDRTLKHTLYKRVLKTYSQVLIERGYHSFFFPAGGRTRTNMQPQSLKLGLVGTALDAYTQNVLQRRAAPVFVVPVTINYNLVLEAETLIEDFLQVKGVRQEVIAKDEFSDPLRIASYFRALTVLDEMVNVNIGTPMDPFGNRVNNRGESLNEQGMIVEPERYLWERGQPSDDYERAHAYTRGLGRKVIEGFKRNNVIAPLHIVSFALFEHVCRQHPSWDVERLLWFAKGDVVSRSVAEGEAERVARIVRRDAIAGKLRLTKSAEHWTAREMVDEALKLYSGYPEHPIVELHGRQLRLADLRLLYYYSNRLRHYDLERRLSSNPGGY